MAAPVIVRDAKILIPCFRGTCVPFQNLLDYLEGGDILDELLAQFPSVTGEMAIDAGSWHALSAKLRGPNYLSQ